MKIERADIAKKLKQLKSVTPPTTTMAVRGILLKEKTLIATNLELTVTTPIKVDTNEQFVIPLNAIDMIENLPNEVIEITEKNNRITIKSSKGKSTFSTIAVEKFPEVDLSAVKIGKQEFTYSGNELIEAINKVIYACNQSSEKPVMTGVLFENNGDKLNIVGCDGFRIAWNILDYNSEISVIIQKTALQKVISLCANDDIELLKAGTNKVAFKTGEYTVYTRLLEGTYINYHQMFKETYPTVIEINREDLIKCLTRSLICSDNVGRNPTVFEGSEVGGFIVSNNSTTGEFSEELEVDGKFGMTMRVGINAKYVIDFLKSVSAEKISISYSSDRQPLLFTDGIVKAIISPVLLRK